MITKEKLDDDEMQRISNLELQEKQSAMALQELFSVQLLLCRYPRSRRPNRLWR